MGFLIATALGTLFLITIAIRIFRDRAKEARYHEIGQEMVSDLRTLFYLIYPDYIEDHRIEFFFSCRRKWLVWGRWNISVKTRFDENMKVDVRSMVMERLARLHADKCFRKKVDIQPIFEVEKEEKNNVSGQK